MDRFISGKGTINQTCIGLAVALLIVVLSSIFWWVSTGGKNLSGEIKVAKIEETISVSCPDCAEKFEGDAELSTHYDFAHGMGVISVDASADIQTTPEKNNERCNIQMKLINQIMKSNKADDLSEPMNTDNVGVQSSSVLHVDPSPGVHHRQHAVHKHLAANHQHSHFTDSESSGSETEEETCGHSSGSVRVSHTEEVVMLSSGDDVVTRVTVEDSIEITTKDTKTSDIIDDSLSSGAVGGSVEGVLGGVADASVLESVETKVDMVSETKANEAAETTSDEVSEEWDVASLLAAGIPTDKTSGVLELCACVGARQGVSEPLSDPITLMRFLNSREGDLADALTMYRETIAWRKSFGLVNILKSFGDISAYESTGTGNLTEHGSTWEYAFNRKPTTTTAEMISKISFFHTLKDTCEDEAPIAIWQLGSIDFAGIVREGLEEQLRGAFLSHLEEVLQLGRAASSRQKKMVRCRVIIDGTGLGLWMLPYLSVLKMITGLGKAYFPETTASATIVNAPWVFARLYGAISPMLTPVMRAKVCILDGSFETGLVAHSGVDLSILPRFLGGNLPDADCPGPKPVPKGAATFIDRTL